MYPTYNEMLSAWAENPTETKPLKEFASQSGDKAVVCLHTDARGQWYTVATMSASGESMGCNYAAKDAADAEAVAAAVVADWDAGGTGAAADPDGTRCDISSSYNPDLYWSRG